MIDLHTHSKASDGTDSPAQVVALAARAGLSAVALTDHDTLAHVPAARAAADRMGVRLIPACEISCDLAGRAPGTLHLLVYFVEPDVGPLPGRLVDLRAARATRNERIVATLQSHGIDISLDEVLDEAGGGTVGRPHVAAVLLRHRNVASIEEAFDRWLAKGRPAYVERRRLGIHESIGLAHDSGAVTSAAHPYSLGLTTHALDAFVGQLSDAGLDALECEYAQYSRTDRDTLHALAAHHGLAVTGGSDYHGTHKPGLSIGTGLGDLVVSDALLDELESRRP